MVRLKKVEWEEMKQKGCESPVNYKLCREEVKKNKAIKEWSWYNYGTS
jgi:ribosomal protein S26